MGQLQIPSGTLWNLSEAWETASEVCAVTFGVRAHEIRAQSRGRGPRPPEAVRPAKKMAIYLTVALTDRDYAVVGRHVGLHRDTIASHCAETREQCADDAVFEGLANELLSMANARLTFLQAPTLRRRGEPRRPYVAPNADERADLLRAYVDGLIEKAKINGA